MTGAHEDLGYSSKERAPRGNIVKDVMNHQNNINAAAEEDRDRVELEGIQELRRKYPSVQWECSRIANKGL